MPKLAKHALLLAAFALAAIVSAMSGDAPSPTPPPSPSDIVYVTASGKRYHRKDCRYAKNARPMTREEAEKKGLTPCKVCKP